MKWNVYNYNTNRREMEVFDIFKHRRFSVDVDENLKKCTDKADFAEKLKSDLMYYFWSKSEYEIFVSSWTGRNGDDETKIDVYKQVMLNWDVFLDYVWSHKMIRKVRVRRPCR